MLRTPQGSLESAHTVTAAVLFSGRRSWFAAGVLLQALCALLCSPAQAQVDGASADQIKAAYLHKIPGYVEWPAGLFTRQDEPFVIGVVGSQPVFEQLTALAAGHPVQGRAVQVRRIERTDVPANVNLVYFGQALGRNLGSQLARFKGLPVITVTDVPEGIPDGAVLNFVERDGRIRFEAAPTVAEQDGLKLSSRLLAVADRVVGAPR